MLEVLEVVEVLEVLGQRMSGNGRPRIGDFG
jgi:hypothetical protein